MFIIENNSVKLTKESDYLICTLYKEYRKRRSDNMPKSEAKCFGSSEEIYISFMPKAIYEDVDETCKELKRANMLKCFESDFNVLRAELTDDAIIYMENRFKSNLKCLTEHIIDLAKIIF